MGHIDRNIGVLQGQQYYDCNSYSDCSSFFANGRGVIPAGTTVYSMPLSDRNDEYRRIKKEYDIAFIFDDMNVEPAFDFIQNIEEWKDHLVLTDEISLFRSQSDAEQVFSFVEAADGNYAD